MEEFDNNYKKDLDNMKRQIQEEKLSDNFKENLYKKMEQAEKAVPKNNRIHFSKGLVAVLACFVFVLISASLAREIDNIVLNHFSNIDKIAKKAVDEGKVKYLNQDYVTDQGISIKANYIFEEGNYMYVVLEAKDESNNIIYIEEFEIYDNTNNLLYDPDYNYEKMDSALYYTHDANNSIYIKFIKDKGDNLLGGHIKIQSIKIESKSNLLEVLGEWNIELK